MNRFAEFLGVAIFKGTFEPIVQLCFAYIHLNQHLINGKGSFCSQFLEHGENDDPYDREEHGGLRSQPFEQPSVASVCYKTKKIFSQFNYLGIISRLMSASIGTRILPPEPPIPPASPDKRITRPVVRAGIGIFHQRTELFPFRIAVIEAQMNPVHKNVRQ